MDEGFPLRYHKVGYLIATGDSFARLVDLANGQTKSSFEAHLNGLIRERLKLSGADLNELSYERNSDKCKRLGIKNREISPVLAVHIKDNNGNETDNNRARFL